MARYSVGGAAHGILERLAGPPASFAEIARDTSSLARTPRRHRYKVRCIVLALRTDGLVDHFDLYHIAQAGRDALACLETGNEVVIAAPPARPDWAPA